MKKGSWFKQHSPWYRRESGSTVWGQTSLQFTINKRWWDTQQTNERTTYFFTKYISSWSHPKNVYEESVSIPLQQQWLLIKLHKTKITNHLSNCGLTYFQLFQCGLAVNCLSTKQMITLNIGTQSHHHPLAIRRRNERENEKKISRQHQSDTEVLIFCIVIYGSITNAFYFNLSSPFIPFIEPLNVSLLRVVVVIEWVFKSIPLSHSVTSPILTANDTNGNACPQ